MVLTLEEKIAKLKAHENWGSFTDAQRCFVLAMAASENVLDAYMRAYPNTKKAGLVFAAHRMIRTVGIRNALESAGIQCAKTDKATVSKQEALELLSFHLRKQGVEAETVVKLLGIYGKLSGWDKEQEKPVDEGVSMDKLIAAVEKRRRETQ